MYRVGVQLGRVQGSLTDPRLYIFSSRHPS
uniref:Uncharacterized protein n=1 Tax=Arundo donax TaxID=35708 RepID=A0A0A9EDV9_ARUDO